MTNLFLFYVNCIYFMMFLKYTIFVMHCNTNANIIYRTQWTAKVLCVFFVREWNISETADRICTKFTRITCLVIRSDEFERSKVKVTRDKNAVFVPFGGLRAVYVW